VYFGRRDGKWMCVRYGVMKFDDAFLPLVFSISKYLGSGKGKLLARATRFTLLRSISYWVSIYFLQRRSRYNRQFNLPRSYRSFSVSRELKCVAHS